MRSEAMMAVVVVVIVVVDVVLMMLKSGRRCDCEETAYAWIES